MAMPRKAAHSAFRDLFEEDEAIELELRAELMNALRRWFDRSGLTQAAAAEVLGTTQARMSDICRGKISAMSLDKLVRLANRAGLKPRLKLAA